MKINEVEALVGITKKNIRFYEEQGLISPSRNAENRYREYSDTEIETLQRIKLLRKLGVPIEEIRSLLKGNHTVADCMRRHIVTLEREKQNTEQALLLCKEMQGSHISAADLDCTHWLNRMEDMEREGTSFSDRQKSDVTQQYTAPIVITFLFVALMMAVIGVVLWALKNDPQEAPIWFIAIVIVFLAVSAVGAVLALVQRIKEIGKGEMDDAKKY